MGVSKVVLSQTRRRRHECSNPISPATSAEAIRWFSHKLHLETDCADVHSAQRAGEVDFVLLHVVGSEEAFARRHLPGAQHLPHSQITAERMAAPAGGDPLVVYCAGPHCNGADVAALKLAELGRPVKMMLGGLTGWEDEGYAFVSGK
ncbi:rhodanese-like domain-containing protein [Klebsiella pneumoniae]|uniref:Rhodanese-like domain-containing protein n=1 Tax=Klebsiella pneumoniae TaxID=573 RepID=A0A927E040_KLEPN|nr:rhodanese-like domain-containing protein [Klebsiella pneumoniae]